jgi:hypothetical protein
MILFVGSCVSEEPAVSSFRLEGSSSRFSEMYVHSYWAMQYVIQKTVTSTSDNLRSREEGSYWRAAMNGSISALCQVTWMIFSTSGIKTAYPS